MGRILALCLLVVGCGVAEPAGMVALENAPTAARSALKLWGEDFERALPEIVGVTADPGCEALQADGSRHVGFVSPDSGRCVGGLTDPERGKIYLLVHPAVTYAVHLPHELQHWLRGDGEHRLRGVWEPPIGESDTNLVPAASAFLRMFPLVDAMKAVE